MSSEIKKIRGQIRQIVKELLPEIFVSSLVDEVIKKIQPTIDKIESNQKNLQSYLLRAEIAKVEAKNILDKVGN